MVRPEPESRADPSEPEPGKSMPEAELASLPELEASLPNPEDSFPEPEAWLPLPEPEPDP